MGRACQQCGGTEIDEDPARGDAICMGCGAVLEESIVVLENQFQERAGGSGHSLVGQFITLERQNPTGTGVGQTDSREVTFYKGKKVIEEVGSQLRINQHCMDTAFNFFKMCVCRNLTRGRMRTHVVAACLYMTCRLENTAHLLLDFSDIMQVNVFDLGRTLSFLSRSLRINLPTTDPCLYILRFAVLLEFGDKQKEIVTLATRLVQRMKRDWLATGRRPTGLCGAALLLAARAHNFNRSVSDVVRVVHVSEHVVRKRLDEFSQTPSAGLTVDEFATVDLEHTEDPPAFREARKKAREAQLLKEQQAAEKMAEELQPVEEELEIALEKKRKEKFKRTPYAKLMGGIGEDDPEFSMADRVVQSEIIDQVFAAANEQPPQPGPSQVHNPYAITTEILGISRNNNAAAATATSSREVERDEEDGSLRVDDIDDDEIDTYILTKKESEIKERFWMRCNGEHLKEMERRRKERLEQEERDRLDPTKKKKKRSTTAGTKRQDLEYNDPMEAIEMVIQEKKLSNKVNYDILKEIEQCEDTRPDFMTVDDIGRQAGDIVEEVNRLCAPKVEFMDSPSMEFALGHAQVATLTLSRGEKRRKREHKEKAKVPLGDVSAQLDGDGPAEDNGLVSSIKSEAPNTSIAAKRARFGKFKPNVKAASKAKESPATPGRKNAANGGEPELDHANGEIENGSMIAGAMTGSSPPSTPRSSVTEASSRIEQVEDFCLGSTESTTPTPVKKSSAKTSSAESQDGISQGTTNKAKPTPQRSLLRSKLLAAKPRIPKVADSRKPVNSSGAEGDSESQSDLTKKAEAVRSETDSQNAVAPTPATASIVLESQLPEEPVIDANPTSTTVSSTEKTDGPGVAPADIPKPDLPAADSSITPKRRGRVPVKPNCVKGKKASTSAENPAELGPSTATVSESGSQAAVGANNIESEAPRQPSVAPSDSSRTSASESVSTAVSTVGQNSSTLAQKPRRRLSVLPVGVKVAPSLRSPTTTTPTPAAPSAPKPEHIIGYVKPPASTPSTVNSTVANGSAQAEAVENAESEPSVSSSRPRRSTRQSMSSSEAQVESEKEPSPAPERKRRGRPPGKNAQQNVSEESKKAAAVETEPTPPAAKRGRPSRKR